MYLVNNVLENPIWAVPLLEYAMLILILLPLKNTTQPKNQRKLQFLM